MRGALYASVLAVVAEGETYGYVIAQRLQEAGLGLVKGGTLYPILGRLEQEGLVRSRWQAGEAAPNRKYFTVTGDGLTALNHLADDWQIFAERVGTLMAQRKARQ